MTGRSMKGLLPCESTLKMRKTLYIWSAYHRGQRKIRKALKEKIPEVKKEQ